MTIVNEPSGEYADLTLEDYRAMGISSYHGGASWLFIHGQYGVSYVVGGKTPLDIRKALESGEPIRAKVIRAKLNDNYQM